MSNPLDRFIQELEKIISELAKEVEKVAQSVVDLFNKNPELRGLLEAGDTSCGNPPEWIIYDKEPHTYTYSCTLHLSDMVSVDTEVINPYEPYDIHAKQKTCCYLSSTDDEEEASKSLEKLNS